MSRAFARRPWAVSVLICGADGALADLLAGHLDPQDFAIRQVPLGPLDASTLPPGEAPDVVVADLDDDDPACWQHATWLRAALPYVRFILLAHGRPSTTEIRRYEPCHYLRKPAAVDGLLAAIRSARPTLV